MILNNPLIQRYRYSLMRPRKFWIYITIYISVVVLILILNHIAYEHQEILDNPAKFFRNIFIQFIVLQILVLCILSSINSGSAIKEEILGNSYDFFRMLPISAGKKTAGILVGKNLIILLFAGVNFFLLTIFGLLGHAKISLLIQMYFVLISIAIFMNSAFLLSSINKVNKKRNNNIIAIIFLCFFLGPFLFSSLLQILNTKELDEITANFYTIELPIIILAGLIVLYFSCWSIAGILRKFTFEDEPLFSRTSAFMFMVGFEVVLLGLFYTYLTNENKSGIWVINYSYWLISLLPAVIVPLGSIRNFNKYIEHCGLIRSQTTENKNMTLRMLLYSNLSLGLILFLIWAIGTIGTTLITELDLLPCLYNISVLFSFYIFLLLLIELNVVYASLSNKVSLLLGFIFVLYTIIPLILSGIISSDNSLYMFSPAGFIFSLFKQPPVMFNSIWIANLALCIIPILLVYKRYLYIISTRKKM